MLKLAGFIRPGPVAFGLVLISFSELGAATTDTSTSTAPGEAQEQITTGTLDAKAENASQAVALYADAMAHDAAGDHQGALQELRQVVLLDPHSIDAQVRLGSLLIDLKKPDEAYTQLKAAVAANPGSPALNAALAAAEQGRGHQDNAEQLAFSALAKDPTQTSAMQVLLDIGANRHALEAQLQQIRDTLHGAHAPVDSYLALVKIYLDVTGKEDPQPTGDVIENALLPIYQVAVKQAPPTTDLLSVLAETYYNLDQKDEALKTLQQALVNDPNNMEVVLRCATLCGEKGSKKQELAYYEKAYVINPNQDGLREDIVRSYYENKEYNKALAMMHQMITDTPDDSMLELRIGVTCETLHEEQQAKMWFDKALASPKCPLDPYIKMAAYYIDLQRPKEAGPVLVEGRKRFPDSAQLAFYQAVQFQDVQNFPDAMQALEDARKLSGGDPSTLGVNFYLESAAIMATSGHRRDIEPMLSDGLKKFPDDPNLLNQQAWEWADEGTNLPSALAVAQHAATVDSTNGSVQDTIGFILLKMGKAEEALPYLQQAVNMTNNDPSVLQHLGDAYLDRGRKTEALAAWRLGLQKDPDNHDLKNRIETNLASHP